MIFPNTGLYSSSYLVPSLRAPYNVKQTDKVTTGTQFLISPHHAGKNFSLIAVSVLMTEAAFFESSFDSGTELWQALISTDKCKLDIVKHLDSCPFLTS